MNPDSRDRAFLSTLRLLYVEDEPEVREQTGRFLARRVKDLVCAADGVEGLTLFREQAPDLVITDIMMPRMDGLAMAQGMRELAPHVPIVVTTAFDQNVHLHRAIEVGVNHYVVKPVDSDQLERCLELCARQLRLERQAAALEAERQRLLHQESIGILAQGLAHDLNNLLQAILGWAGLARTLAEPGGKVANALAQMEVSEQQGKALAERLFLLNKTGFPQETGTLEGPLKEAVVEALAGSTVEVEYRLDGLDTLLHFDLVHIRQVFLQLTLNAREAMTERGRLRVSSERCVVEQGNPMAMLPGPCLHLTFQDEGPGIDADVLSRIWDPYFTTKHQFSKKGLGLGLAVCQAVLRQHRGALAVDSQPGLGSAFHVYLPLN